MLTRIYRLKTFCHGLVAIALLGATGCVNSDPEKQSLSIAAPPLFFYGRTPDTCGLSTLLYLHWRDDTKGLLIDAFCPLYLYVRSEAKHNAVFASPIFWSYRDLQTGYRSIYGITTQEGVTQEGCHE